MEFLLCVPALPLIYESYRYLCELRRELVIHNRIMNDVSFYLPQLYSTVLVAIDSVLNVHNTEKLKSENWGSDTSSTSSEE
jgi:hypothetical protein